MIKAEKKISWKELVFQHLEKYKVETLRVKENGLFQGREYGHILPKEYQSLNYMDLVRSHEQEFESMKHKYWYHLNSSQTMCINFFVPLMDKGLLSLFFKKVLGIEKEITYSQFEKVLENEITYFDFYAEDKEGHHYYFEIKYTEDTVSEKTTSKRVDEVYKTIFLKDVKVNSTFTSALVDDDLFMNKHYQAYRTMVKAKEGDYAIFIIMDGNVGVANEVNKALLDLNLTSLEAREKNILILHWSEVVSRTQQFIKEINNQELIEHYREFYKKYLDF